MLWVTGPGGGARARPGWEPGPCRGTGTSTSSAGLEAPGATRVTNSQGLGPRPRDPKGLLWPAGGRRDIPHPGLNRDEDAHPRWHSSERTFSHTPRPRLLSHHWTGCPPPWQPRFPLLPGPRWGAKDGDPHLSPSPQLAPGPPCRSLSLRPQRPLCRVGAAPTPPTARLPEGEARPEAVELPPGPTPPLPRGACPSLEAFGGACAGPGSNTNQRWDCGRWAAGLGVLGRGGRSPPAGEVQCEGPMWGGGRRLERMTRLLDSRSQDGPGAGPHPLGARPGHHTAERPTPPARGCGWALAVRTGRPWAWSSRRAWGAAPLRPRMRPG